MRKAARSLCGAGRPPSQRRVQPVAGSWISFVMFAGVGAGHPASWQTRTIALFVSKYTCQ
jgi:hypothetical protein